MGSHPINLAVRFILELMILGTAALWGWKNGEGWIKYALVILLPVILGALWGTFAVPDDPSRSGNAPFPVPGLVRLLLEFAMFAFAAWCLYKMGFNTAFIIFVAVSVVHYALSYDRITWLLNQ